MRARRPIREHWATRGHTRDISLLGHYHRTGIRTSRVRACVRLDFRRIGHESDQASPYRRGLMVVVANRG